MFDFLKKKVSSFTEKIKNSIEKKKDSEEKEKIGQDTVFKEEPELKEKKALDTKIEIEPTEPTIEEKPVFPAEEKRELKAKVSIGKKIKAIISKKITISESDIKLFLEEFEFSLLEADVEAGTAQKIVEKIREDFVGKDVSTKDVSGFLKEEIKSILLKIMETEKIEFLTEIEKKKPFVVLFLGPNGAGKTTSIAKIAHLLKKNGKTVVLSASDTFRAASIEQLEVHAQALNLKIIKHDYGADPAAVAFDAIAFAKAKNIDVVLIDSAGRQETNKNLIEELKKIERVAKPDLKIFVGESYAGQTLLNQAKEFDNALNIDGFVLTKIDVDSKGGTAISLLYTLKKPVLFVGVGQNYEDLVDFEPKFIVEKIV